MGMGTNKACASWDWFIICENDDSYVWICMWALTTAIKFLLHFYEK